MLPLQQNFTALIKRGTCLGLNLPLIPPASLTLARGISGLLLFGAHPAELRQGNCTPDASRFGKSTAVTRHPLTVIPSVISRNGYFFWQRDYSAQHVLGTIKALAELQGLEILGYLRYNIHISI